MSPAARRRAAARTIYLDRSLERLPIFRLSDGADEGSIGLGAPDGSRWRVLASPGDRLPGTFDQDVYVELMHRFQEAGAPLDGIVTFTLHAFLRSMDRRVDGRTYEQLRSALVRLERTTLESALAYESTPAGGPVIARFSVLAALVIERRRSIDREQLPLFSATPGSEPGVARVTISPLIRDNLAARHVSTISLQRYLDLASPVARRLYRLIEVARAEDVLTWRVSFDRLREILPLAQRYPSHLQRVLQPAHDMLTAMGVVRSVSVRQQNREWFVDYVLGGRNT